MLALVHGGKGYMAVHLNMAPGQPIHYRIEIGGTGTLKEEAR